MDPAELKNLHTAVLDLEELKRLLPTATRPRVRSILSREIGDLEGKILSSSAGSDGKASREEDCSSEGILVDPSLKRKHKGIDEPESSMMKKKSKLAASGKPLVGNGHICKNLEEKPHQQLTRTSERVCSSRKRLWCRICRVNTHAESKCWLRNAICSYCRRKGHLKARCPKVRRVTVSLSPSARITVTASGSCKNTQGKPNQQSLPTRASEQILLDEEASADVIKRSTAVVAIEKVDVAEKPNQNTIEEPLVMIGNNSESTQEELNQQTLPTRTSEQVSWKKANPSDVNKASILTTVATENNNVLNQIDQTIASLSTTSALGFTLASPKKGRFRHTCQLTDVKSDCFRCNGTCFNCQKTGHIMAHCPELTEKPLSPCGKIAVTANSSCNTTKEELNQQSLTTNVSEQAMLDKNGSADVNKTSTMAVIATEIADVSKKKPNFSTVKEPIVIIGSRCKSTLEEPNQRSLQTKMSQQVLREKANPSDVNEITLGAVATIKNADVSNKTSQIVSPSGKRTIAAASSCTSMQEEQNQHPLPTKTSEEILRENSIHFDTNKASHVTVFAINNADVSSKKSATMTKGAASSRSRVASSRNVPWCCTCKLPASQCSVNGSCLNCHEMGHSTANCPKKKAQVAFSLSGTGTITAGSSPTSTPAERDQQSLQKAPAAVNATSGVAVIATENADVSNKTGQSMSGMATVKGKTSQISQEKTQKTTHKGVSTQPEATIAISESKAVPPKKGSWCYGCQRHHTNSCPSHIGHRSKYPPTGHFGSGYHMAHQRVSNRSSYNVQYGFRYDWQWHGGAWPPAWVDPFRTWN